MKITKIGDSIIEFKESGVFGYELEVMICLDGDEIDFGITDDRCNRSVRLSRADFDLLVDFVKKYPAIKPGT